MRTQSCCSYRRATSSNPNLLTPKGPNRHGWTLPVSQIGGLNLLTIVSFVLVTVLLNLGTFSSTALSATASEESSTSEAENNRLIPLIVHLEQFLHFNNLDGQDTVVSPGMYLVEPIIQGEPCLVFWDEHGTVTLQATRTTHNQQMKTPETHLIGEEANEDIHRVVVFLRDGIALEAIGSVSGIQARGNFRVTSHYHLDAATGVVRFGDGQQGRRLPTSQSNVSAEYRKGLGSQKGAELNMIELQSLISKRQMAVQLTTSLLSRLHGQFQLEEATDRPGDDYARQMENSPESCRTRCERDGNCQAFTFVKPKPGFPQGQCFLKRSEPKPVANRCCISGTRSSTEQKIIRNIGR
ncbi:MAG: PAN domain-containing protein [Nitrospirales bacterium]